jgi:hypothetical protein
MALTKQLTDYTLREILEAVQGEKLRDATQLLQVIGKQFQLPLALTAAPGSDITDRAGRLVGVVTSKAESNLRAGGAMIAHGDEPATVSNQSRLQLWNPAGSGKVLVLRGLVVEPGAASTVQLRDYSAPLLTLDRTGKNRRMGGAAGVGEIRSETTVDAGTSTEIAQVLDVLRPELLQAIVDEGLEIPAGRGLVVVPSSTNVSVLALFIWDEE